MTPETKQLALKTLYAAAGLAEDNYRRAKASGYGHGPAMAGTYKAEWDRLLAAIADLVRA